ncbi:unnamed protein product [Paramecium sonneborni]|uniref:G domain-containing protein n=1 Tax=Paramecium sonneborni TaxID=65129 RepID=A0A8S1N858_9CILI|nr:unnamed protein product [Paramecium sonneborni]
MSQLRVVLLGVLGNGKTSLFNKITSANEPVTYGGKSVTKQIVIGQSMHGEFEIVDTPGFEAREDKLLHAAGVIAALSQGNVNRILIVVKCDRTDLMIKNIKKIIGTIQRYRDFITIVVSYWDELKRNYIQNQKKIEELKSELKQEILNNFNVSSVIFSSIDDDPKTITKDIINIIVNSRFTNIKLLESEIYSQFDLLSLDDDNEKEYNSFMNKIKNAFRKISLNCIKYIKKQNVNDPDLIDKLHFLTLAIKQIANEEVEKFEIKYGEYMNELYDTDGINIQYLNHIYLKKEISYDLERVIMEAQKKMKESKNHCFNWIKQCPFCGLVWIKVIGCDNETTCGNRVNSDYDDLLTKVNLENKFKIIVKNNLIDIEIEQSNQNQCEQSSEIDSDQFYLKNLYMLYNSVKDDVIFQNQYGTIFDINTFHQLICSLIDLTFFRQFCLNINDLNKIESQNQWKQFLSQNGYYSQIQDKSLGCGKKIVWKDLPPLSGPLLKELLSTELIDYFNDQEQLLKDEANDIAKELERTYKNLVNQAIKEQLKNVKVIPKQKQQTQEQQQQDPQQFQEGNIVENYKVLINKTKQEQLNVKRRYSIKMMTDENIYSEAETNDTSRTQIQQ